MASLNIEIIDSCSGQFRLLKFPHKGLVINLIPLVNEYEAAELISLQELYHQDGENLVHLWEDIWKTRERQVMSRFQSLLGLNKRIHGRKTSVVSVSKPQADEFMEANHIQGAASSKYRLGLQFEDRLVAIACFSNLRTMKTEGSGVYKSAEVIRFASVSGYTVTGGFTKLLKHFIAKFAPDDIMSYADRDWSSGKVYEQAGFALAATTPPSDIYLHKETLNRYFPHRLPTAGQMESVGTQNDAGFYKIFNTGNLKYIYKP